MSVPWTLYDMPCLGYGEDSMIYLKSKYGKYEVKSFYRALLGYQKVFFLGDPLGYIGIYEKLLFYSLSLPLSFC